MNSGLTDTVATELARKIIAASTKDKTPEQTWADVLKLLFETIKSESVIKIDTTVLTPGQNSSLATATGPVTGTISGPAPITGKIT